MIIFVSLLLLLLLLNLTKVKSSELDEKYSNNDITIKDIPTQSVFVIKNNNINSETTNKKQIVKTFERTSGLNACDEVTFVQKDDTEPTFVFKLYNNNDDKTSSSSSSSSSSSLLFKNNVWISNDPSKVLYLYYIDASTAKNTYGTWLIGDEIGVDKGIAYNKPSQIKLVPTFNHLMDSNSNSEPWYMLENGEWKVQEDLQVFCTNNPVGDYFYSVKVLNAEEEKLMDSIIIQRQGEKSISSSPSISCDDDEYNDGTQFYLYNSKEDTWDLIESLEYIMELGQSYLLSSNSKVNDSCVGILINTEFLFRGYRLMFRCNNVDEERYGYLLSSGFLEESALALFTHDDTGASIPKPLSIDLATKERSFTSSTLSNAKNGDYIWLWYRPNANEGSKELILKCISSSDKSSVFEYWDADRNIVMHRSEIDRVVNVITFQHEKEILIVNNKECDLLSAIPLGDVPNVLNYLRNFLLRSEGLFGGISSCFMYHAGIAIPKSFVYAAELVCVLAGAKQVAMIQYDSPNEMQWKFPLVPEISSLVVTSLRHRPELDLHVSENSYREEYHTLLISRRAAAVLGGLLRPPGKAQALHLLPFPDDPDFSGDTEKIYRHQVFNSWWNGLILGYPVHFIRTYCSGITHEIDDVAIQEEGKRAEQAASDYFRRYATEGPSNALPIEIGFKEGHRDILDDVIETAYQK